MDPSFSFTCMVLKFAGVLFAPLRDLLDSGLDTEIDCGVESDST